MQHLEKFLWVKWISTRVLLFIELYNCAWWCAWDVIILEVSIYEKISVWHALLTPGKQMCSTGQALKLRSIVVVTNPQLWSSFHWGTYCAVTLWGCVCVHVNLVVHCWALYCEPCCDLSLKTWAELHYHVVVMLSAYVFGVMGRARGPKHLFLVETKICISGAAPVEQSWNKLRLWSKLYLTHRHQKVQ